MSGKRYAFVPMDVDEVGPQKVEKKSKHRRRDENEKSSSRRDSHRKSHRTRSRSRSRSPRPDTYKHKSKSIRRQGEKDFDDRWGDEEPGSEPDPSEDGRDEEPESKELPKRVKTRHEEDEDKNDGA